MTEFVQSSASTPGRTTVAQPTSLSALPGLRAIADAYDLVLCDVFGVLHDATTVHAEAMEALIRFRERGGIVVLISNSASPGAHLQQSLQAKGLSRDGWDSVVSSADIARAMLRKRGIRAAAHIGSEQDRVLFDGIGVDVVRPEDAEIIVCTGFPEVVGSEERILAIAHDRQADLICTNPDRWMEHDGVVLRFAGLIAARYARRGGRVLWAGKPDPSIYAAAVDRATAASGRRFDPAQVIGIGDSLALDVIGALAQGFGAIWVVGGEREPNFDALSQIDGAGPTSLDTTHAVRWSSTLRW